MELIFAAATCSVIVSILLKWFKAQNYVPMQMITANYAIASLLAYLWFKPDLAHISVSETPWWLIILLGIALPSVFLCLSKSLQTAGIVKTEIAHAPPSSYILATSDTSILSLMIPFDGEARFISAMILILS